RLVEAGAQTQEEADELFSQVLNQLRASHEALKQTFGKRPAAPTRDGRIPASAGGEVTTPGAAERLRALNQELLAVADRFPIHPQLARQLERRRETIEQGGIDWGQGEALAYASLLVDGVPVRLTGQDTERGTFSHRHVVLHDAHTGVRYAPMQ